MNRFILSLMTIFYYLPLCGQMFPLSDQYLYNTLAINPAFAGCHDALSATVSYRNQWVGFKDAPKNYRLSVHAPVDNDRIGLGILIENNSIGIYQETSFIGNYAYRRDLFEGKFALGLGFGATVYNVAWNELEATDADDELLMNNNTSAVLPNFSLGTYYYTKKYFIGISLPLFLSHEQDQHSGNYKIKNNFSEYDYFFTGGYKADISKQFKLLPSLLIKYHPNHTIQVDYNAEISYKEKIWMGLGYRNSEMLVSMLRCQLNNQLNLAYSYDFEFGNMGKYKSGSHEIVLNYIFSYERKVFGPRQF